VVYIADSGKTFRRRPGPQTYSAMFDKWRSAYESGVSVHAIADIDRVAPSTVWRVLKGGDVQMRGRTQPRKPQRGVEAEKRRKTGRESFRRRKYGVFPEDVKRMLFLQAWRCAICGTAVDERSSVDHNHITGRARGILCRRCNQALGFLKADRGTDSLRSALRYLEEAEDGRRARETETQCGRRDGEAGTSEMVVQEARAEERGLDGHNGTSGRLPAGEVGDPPIAKVREPFFAGLTTRSNTRKVAACRSSMRTTIPPFIAELVGIKPGTIVAWETTARPGELVLRVVRHEEPRKREAMQE